MPLPEVVQVRLSSEAAEYLTLTPVVVEELTTDQLLENILGVTGPDTARVVEILQRGTLVSGATRFRWAGMDPALEEVERAIDRLPKAEPGRPLDRERMVRVILTGPRARIEIAREAARRRKFLRRRSFWDVLLELRGEPAYAGYSYKDRADSYRMALSQDAQERLKAGADLIAFPTLAQQVRGGRVELIDWVVAR